MKRIAAILLLMSFTLLAYAPKPQGCLTVDIMLLIDWSYSENGNEKLLTSAAMLFASGLNINNNQIRMGVMTFADEPVGLVGITGDKEKLKEEILNLSNTKCDGNTYLNNAILNASTQLNNGRKVLKIIIVISDGDVVDIDQASKNVELLKTIMPLQVFAIQIGGYDGSIISNRSNLILLTGSPLMVEYSNPNGLLEALKKLDLCN
jgi:uncharacterized protein with von Willebrand factor type A (vWA) domain